MATALASTAVGYSLERFADLSDPAVRERFSGSGIKAFAKIAEIWQLTEPQARGLLGGIASSTFNAWRNEPEKQKLNQDTLSRISLVIGIYTALHSYFGEELADRWVSLRNRGSMFAGVAPVEYMIGQGQPGMFQVRRMLDTWTSGS